MSDGLVSSSNQEGLLTLKDRLHSLRLVSEIRGAAPLQIQKEALCSFRTTVLGEDVEKSEYCILYPVPQGQKGRRTSGAQVRFHKKKVLVEKH